jgi:hypothetical protein
MSEDEIQLEKVRILLAQAKQVHIGYEADALGGKYDEEWPRWYAEYLLENGLSDLLALGKSNVDVDRLASLLADADVKHRADAPESDWMPYYARYLIEATAGKK